MQTHTSILKFSGVQFPSSPNSGSLIQHSTAILFCFLSQKALHCKGDQQEFIHILLHGPQRPLAGLERSLGKRHDSRGEWNKSHTSTVETPNNGECQTEKSVSGQRTDKTSSSLPKSCNTYHGRSGERTNQRLLKEPFKLVFCNQSLFLLFSKQSCLTFLQLPPNPLIWVLFFSVGHVISRETTASWAWKSGHRLLCLSFLLHCPGLFPRDYGKGNPEWKLFPQIL